MFDRAAPDETGRTLRTADTIRVYVREEEWCKNSVCCETGPEGNSVLVQRWKQDEDRVLQAEHFWILTRVRLIKHNVTTRVSLRTSSHRVLFPSGLRMTGCFSQQNCFWKETFNRRQTNQTNQIYVWWDFRTFSDILMETKASGSAEESGLSPCFLPQKQVLTRHQDFYLLNISDETFPAVFVPIKPITSEQVSGHL